MKSIFNNRIAQFAFAGLIGVLALTFVEAQVFDPTQTALVATSTPLNQAATTSTTTDTLGTQTTTIDQTTTTNGVAQTNQGPSMSFGVVNQGIVATGTDTGVGFGSGQTDGRAIPADGTTTQMTIQTTTTPVFVQGQSDGRAIPATIPDNQLTQAPTTTTVVTGMPGLSMQGSVITVLGATTTVSAPFLAVTTFSAPTPVPIVVDIEQSGDILIRGFVTSSDANSVTIETWGGRWTIRASITTTVAPSGSALMSFSQGDLVGAIGTVAVGEPLTVDATIIRNWTTTMSGGTTGTLNVTGQTPTTGTIPVGSGDQGGTTSTGLSGRATGTTQAGTETQIQY